MWKSQQKASMTSHRRVSIWTLAGFVIALYLSSAALLAKDVGNKPAPDVADAKYGPHDLNTFDLWKAKSNHPTPLLVFIHGGGFSAGRKETLPPPLLDRCLKAGISVATINYRLSPGVCFPAHYMDCARAIQFLRSKSKELNLDPKRVALSGSSAGAGTSLWLGFHDDLADAKSEDPVLRESTRVTCIAVFQAQSTYVPRVIKSIIGESAAQHPALGGFYGLTPEEFESPKAYKLYDAASPVTHLKAGAPPVYAFYAGERRPLPPGGKPGAGIHHINMGIHLKEKMDKLGIECIVHNREDDADPNAAAAEFLVKHLHPGSVE